MMRIKPAAKHANSQIRAASSTGEGKEKFDNE
jgi:hypothetical protein